MNLGRLTVLKARMNQELHTAASYKPGGGNLFVVFGEPDIALHHDPDDQCRVEIRGVDIFDPTSGDVLSSGDVNRISPAGSSTPTMTATASSSAMPTSSAARTRSSG